LLERREEGLRRGGADAVEMTLTNETDVFLRALVKRTTIS
jgi:hypothetical protein